MPKSSPSTETSSLHTQPKPTKQTNNQPNASRGPRPLELLLTSKFFDSGDPGASDGATAASVASSLLSPVLMGGKLQGVSGDALEEAVAKEVTSVVVTPFSPLHP